MRHISLRAPMLQGFYTAQSLDLGVQAHPLPLWCSQVPPSVPYVKYLWPSALLHWFLQGWLKTSYLPECALDIREHSHTLVMPVRCLPASHPPDSALTLSLILFLLRKTKRQSDIPWKSDFQNWGNANQSLSLQCRYVSNFTNVSSSPDLAEECPNLSPSWWDGLHHSQVTSHEANDWGHTLSLASLHFLDIFGRKQSWRISGERKADSHST